MPISFSHSSSAAAASSAKKKAFTKRINAGTDTAAAGGGGGGGPFAFTCGCKDASTAFVAPSPASSSTSAAATTTTSSAISSSIRRQRCRPGVGTSMLESGSTSTSTSTTFVPRCGCRQLAAVLLNDVKEEKQAATAAAAAAEEEKGWSATISASFSDLLQELHELELSVIALDDHRSMMVGGEAELLQKEANEEDHASRRASSPRGTLNNIDDGSIASAHRRPDSTENLAARRTDASRKIQPCKEEEEEEEEGRRWGRTEQTAVGRRADRLGGGVAVVTETEDPVGDFRRSMLAMVAENGIDREDELKQLLCKFLDLNSPQHHRLILRAFAHVWNVLFSSSSGDGGWNTTVASAAITRRRRRMALSYHSEDSGPNHRMHNN